MKATKLPESVLVVIHTPAFEVLLLERADHPGFWQSVTGSRHTWYEPLRHTCIREVFEETGLTKDQYQLSDWHQTNRYEIFKHWRNRFPAGVTHNCEHVYGLTVPSAVPVTLAPDEHLRYEWLDWKQAQERCFSWTNVAAIRQIPQRLKQPARAASMRGG
ncbi:MAG: dihydroneopterin triphosphate diphosphatase [Burkholderiaceae bacterium]